METAVAQQQFAVRFAYPIHFTHDLFAGANRVLVDLVRRATDGASPGKVLVVVDEGVVQVHRELLASIERYARQHADVMQLVRPPLAMVGGEAAKNDARHLSALYEAIFAAGLCRHSFVIVVGGGALLDLVGYAAATAHRGIRLIRVPTTALAQCDSGVGVKNAINAFGRKNFLGTFAPPFAVLNDAGFLPSLDDREWRGGIAEAIKVALIKDAAFVQWIEANAAALVARDLPAMRYLIRHCAQLHLDHIASSGDPFEYGSSRPLDFGHWAAHKLEQLTNYRLRHGEAVAIGMAVDVLYSSRCGLLAEGDCRRILALLGALGFALDVPELHQYLDDPAHEQSVLHGLEEFREHLGGELTVMLLARIGQGIEVHEMDLATVRESIAALGAVVPGDVR